MKKLILVFLAIMLAAVMIFSSCASKAVSTTTASSHPTATTTATATATSTYSQPPAYTVTATATTTSTYPAHTIVPTSTAGIPASSNTIGLAAGGAKDIANFRENIRNNYLPQPTDVTYEGLFYDYYFDTGAASPTDKLYSPSYSYAVTSDPFSHQTEYYLSVGLNSGLKESDFQRKILNLVIVLDNSGSMGEQYTQYYYDQWGNQTDAYGEEGINRPSKMDSANEAVVSILNQLNDDDRFAIVTFNSSARVEKFMDYVNNTDIWNVKDDVLNIDAGGSTNLEAGLLLAAKQFSSNKNSYEYENRIIVLTDAQPNTGDFSSGGLGGMLEDNANRRIYTTFIGVGVDFNSDLIEQITKIKGSNYYSVHSPRQFRNRIEEEFDYMVTPLVFDLSLSFESRGWRIEKVFGSPEADEATGSLMKINTLFASTSEGGETRGGLVLLKLKKASSASNAPVYLRTAYEDRNGRTDGDEQVIYLESAQPEYFDNTGIRKGILLSRYAALLKNWMIDERQHIAYSQPWSPCITEDSGIIVPIENISQWERQSLPLTVSGSYDLIFSDFADYFYREMKTIGDNDLDQELDILNMLSRY
jgi:Ca-activated chloride channel homolog